MLVHVVSRPLRGVHHIPRSGLNHLVEGLRSCGVEVLSDIEAARSLDPQGEVDDLVRRLSQAWATSAPDLVHAVGSLAVRAALRARRPGTRIVATFDERPAHLDAEAALAREVDAVLPLSRAERDQWRRRGVPTLSSGALGLPFPAPDRDRCASPDGAVVTLSAGPVLEALVAGMPFWSPARLVVMSDLDALQQRRIRRIAEHVGAADRLDFRPSPRGRDREQVWRQAAVVVAGPDGARHGGHVLEAAAWGVPCVAVAREAHLDHVVPGATGLLVTPEASERDLGLAIAGLLRDPMRLRGLGASALVRVAALNEPTLASERLVALYRQLLESESADSEPEVALPAPRMSPETAELALEHLPLARQLAGWYIGKGQPMDDLVQVASLGLVRAAERFDPAHGKEFHSFAIPTILGELRRHFRDHAWAVRLPRGLQEATLQVQRAADDLRQTLGRDASAADVAERLGLIEEEVVAARQAEEEVRSPRSLDHPVGDGGDETFSEIVGSLDPALDLVEKLVDVRQALRQLPPREQEIIVLRFYGERTQSEIAERLGISQVHVSRVLSRTLAALRDHVLYDVPLPRTEDEQGAQPAGAGHSARRRRAS